MAEEELLRVIHQTFAIHLSLDSSFSSHHVRGVCALLEYTCNVDVEFSVLVSVFVSRENVFRGLRRVWTRFLPSSEEKATRIVYDVCEGFWNDDELRDYLCDEHVPRNSRLVFFLYVPFCVELCYTQIVQKSRIAQNNQFIRMA